MERLGVKTPAKVDNLSRVDLDRSKLLGCADDVVLEVAVVPRWNSNRRVPRRAQAVNVAWCQEFYGAKSRHSSTAPMSPIDHETIAVVSPDENQKPSTIPREWKLSADARPVPAIPVVEAELTTLTRSSQKARKGGRK